MVAAHDADADNANFQRTHPHSPRPASPMTQRAPSTSSSPASPLAWPKPTGDPYRTEPEHVLLPILTPDRGAIAAVARRIVRGTICAIAVAKDARTARLMQASRAGRRLSCSARRDRLSERIAHALIDVSLFPLLSSGRLAGRRCAGRRLRKPPMTQPAYGPELQGFEYPWPVSYFAFTSQGEAMRMAYMDVKPAAAPNGKTAVLFHGKNFCAATWQDTIAALTRGGLSGDRRRSDRFLQIDQARALSVHASSNSPATPTRCWLRSASSARPSSAIRSAACSACATR